MALNAFLKLRGQKQGEIKGSVTQKGLEGRILVIAAEHQVVSPRDAATGMASGKRMHRPFVITKEVDAASPLLYTMLTNSETAAEWELQFWGPSNAAPAGTGSDVQRYTVRLTEASLSDIHFRLPNTRDPNLLRYSETEEVAFTYSKIQWLWVPTNLSSSDSWAASRGASQPPAAPGSEGRG